MTTGYSHALYAQSLSEFGQPLFLPASQGYVLARTIPGSEEQDCMGCYPFYSCKDWKGFDEDLDRLKQFISLGLVTEPFGNYTESLLKKYFPDKMIPYKEHFVIDLTINPESNISHHHQRSIRKAYKNGITIERITPPSDYIEQWSQLYQKLIERHQITGISTFSKQAFSLQLNVPGAICFKANYGATLVGMMFWYVQQDVAYYHLAAYNEQGYELGASFALMAESISYFSSFLQWMALGAGAGTFANPNDGLSRFKQGWTPLTRQVYFCGKIFQPAAYQHLNQQTPHRSSDFFPSYRNRGL